eukprot:3628232-Prymnesium_polylepis.1
MVAVVMAVAGMAAVEMVVDTGRGFGGVRAEGMVAVARGRWRSWWGMSHPKRPRTEDTGRLNSHAISSSSAELFRHGACLDCLKSCPCRRPSTV